jgi:hypothetical protein
LNHTHNRQFRNIQSAIESQRLAPLLYLVAGVHHTHYERCAIRRHQSVEPKRYARFATMSSLCTANNRNMAPRPYRRLLERRLKTEDGIEVWPLDDFVEAVARKTLWP